MLHVHWLKENIKNQEQSSQTTPKSGEAKTSQKIRTCQALFTILSRYLVGLDSNITYQHKSGKPTPLRGVGN